MSAIDDLIARSEESYRNEAAETARRHADKLQALTAAVDDNLGAVWQELKPYCAGHSGENPYLQVEHPDLGAFVIAEGPHGLSVYRESYRGHGPLFALSSADLSPFSAFLAARRAEVSAERDRKRAEQLSATGPRIAVLQSFEFPNAPAFHVPVLRPVVGGGHRPARPSPT